MPLDGSSPSTPDLTNYSLEGLAWILRNGNDGHEWYFPQYCKCAIRTAQARWGDRLTPTDLAFGNSDAAFAIFKSGSSLEDSKVTPEIVADRIDDFLAGRQIRLLVKGDRDQGDVVWNTNTADLVDA